MLNTLIVTIIMYQVLSELVNPKSAELIKRP